MTEPIRQLSLAYPTAFLTWFSHHDLIHRKIIIWIVGTGTSDMAFSETVQVRISHDRAQFNTVKSRYPTAIPPEPVKFGKEPPNSTCLGRLSIDQLVFGIILTDYFFAIISWLNIC